MGTDTFLLPSLVYQGLPGGNRHLFIALLILSGIARWEQTPFYCPPYSIRDCQVGTDTFLLPSLFYQGLPGGNKDLFIALLILSGIARWEHTLFYYPLYSIRDCQVGTDNILLTSSLFYQGSPGGNRQLFITFLISSEISRWERTPFYCPPYSIRDCQVGTDTFLLTSSFCQGSPGGNRHLFLLTSSFCQGSPGGNRHLFIALLILSGIARWEQTLFYNPLFSIGDCEMRTENCFITFIIISEIT